LAILLQLSKKSKATAAESKAVGFDLKNPKRTALDS